MRATIISIVFCVFLFACKQIPSTIPAIEHGEITVSAPDQITAGESFDIKIYKASELTKVIITSVLGSDILESIHADDHATTYLVTPDMTHNSGVLKWTAIDGADIISGIINILPQNQTNDIEVYIGPTTMTAGTPRSAMTTAVLTDTYDNILPDGSTTTITTSQSGNPKLHPLKTEDGIAYLYHDAPTKSGNIFTSVTAGNTSSEEYSYQVNAAHADEIIIKAIQQHPYADGSTPLTISTDKITDIYGNVVDNGTLVSFIARDHRGYHSTAQGYTVDGIATGVLVHPSSETTWTVVGQLSGLSSNTISLVFATAVESLPLSLSSTGHFTVGPLISYMGQLIPEGLPIKIQVYQADEKIYDNTIYTQKGKVDLYLNHVITQELNDDITVKVSGAGLTDSIAYKSIDE